MVAVPSQHLYAQEGLDTVARGVVHCTRQSLVVCMGHRMSRCATDFGTVLDGYNAGLSSR